MVEHVITPAFSSRTSAQTLFRISHFSQRLFTTRGHSPRSLQAMPSRSVKVQRRAILAAFVIALVIGHAETAAAQNHGDPTTNFLELGVHYGAPERLSGSLTGVFFYRQSSPRTGKALTMRAAAGEGGFNAGLGHRWGFYGPFGADASMTVTRTFSSPRKATGQATYVGLEVGYVSMGRVSIGVARQVDGPSDRRDTILTWSVGVQLPSGLLREIF